MGSVMIDAIEAKRERYAKRAEAKAESQNQKNTSNKKANKEGDE